MSLPTPPHNEDACWVWETLGWLPPGSRCADRGHDGTARDETEVSVG